MGRTRHEALAAVPDPDAAAEAFAPVDSLLWSERALLQRLLYQLSAQDLVIRAGRVDWLRDSDLEVRALVLDLEWHEVGRAAETDPLAARYGLPPGASLGQIVDAAPDPWRFIMADHLHALRRLQDAVEHTAAGNAVLLRAVQGRPSSPVDGNAAT